MHKRLSEDLLCICVNKIAARPPRFSTPTPWHTSRGGSFKFIFEGFEDQEVTPGMSFLIFREGFVCVENKEDTILRMSAWTRNPELPVTSIKEVPTWKEEH